MIIGTFRYEAAADTYTGEIRTLSVQRSHVVLRPNSRATDREPDYRVVQFSDGGAVELGAAWRRRTERGQDYLSVLLDDPTLAQPLSVALFSGEDDLSANLIWTRPARRAPSAEAQTQPAVASATRPKEQGGRRRNSARPAARPT